MPLSEKSIQHIDEVVEEILHPEPAMDNTIAQLNLVAHLGEFVAPRWAQIRERLAENERLRLAMQIAGRRALDTGDKAGTNGAFWAADDCYAIADILNAALKESRR